VKNICLVSEHQQSRGCSGRRCRGIHIRAVQNHCSTGFAGSVHEADAREEEEQRETDQEVEGVVGPDPGRSCAGPETSGQQVEIEVEIKMSRRQGTREEEQQTDFPSFLRVLSAN
jgi:hypothetical protein